MSGALVVAVAVMHIVMIGCVLGGSSPTGPTAHAASDPHATHGVTVAAASASVTEKAGAPTDCVMGDHACVFIRADAVVMTPAVGPVLAIAPLAVAVDTRLARRGVVLGRAPPWAVPDHLELSVIRR